MNWGENMMNPMTNCPKASCKKIC